MKVLYLITWLFVSINLTSAVKNSTIFIPGSNIHNASNYGSLQYYLCGNGSHYLMSGMTLSLSSSIHIITPGPFCLLQHLMNIMITTSYSNPAHIICDNVNQPTRGFGFLNTTGLTLYNLHIEHCGGILTPTAVSSINQSRVCFPMGQTAVLLFAVSSRLTLNNISITGMYYGYGIIIGNCYDKVTLNYITISSDSKSIKHYCSRNKHSWECAGSGLLLLYGKPLLRHSIIDVYNVHISENNNHYPLEDSPLDILLSFETRKVPLFGAGGITNTVLCDNVQIVYENCTIERNDGNRGGGMLVIYTPVPTNMNLFMNFNFVNFIGNELTEKGNGAGLAMYVLLDDHKSAYPMDSILHSQQTTYCFICMYNSIFSNQSKAVFGGGMYIGLRVMDHHFPSILLDTVGFLLNEANSGGSALYVEEMLQPLMLKALYMNVTRINTFVTNNGKKLNDFFFNLHFIDVAVLEFVRINTVHIEKDESIFEYNFGSPIKLSSTKYLPKWFSTISFKQSFKRWCNIPSITLISYNK